MPGSELARPPKGELRAAPSVGIVAVLQRVGSGMQRAILARHFAGHFAGFVAGLFVVVGLPIAVPARAELPMSPVLRDGPGGMSQPPAPLAPAVKPAHNVKKEPAKLPQARPAWSPTSKTSGRQQSGDHASPVVATAPIPPPVAPAPEAQAKPLPPQKTAAARHHRRQRHYARRYPPAYQPAAGWTSSWAATGATQLGPNPYSPNGGD